MVPFLFSLHSSLNVAIEIVNIMVQCNRLLEIKQYFYHVLRGRKLTVPAFIFTV